MKKVILILAMGLFLSNNSIANIYDNAEDYFPSVITEEKMNKDLPKETTFKKLTINGMLARDKHGNKIDTPSVPKMFEKNGKYIVISQFDKNEKRNIHCMLNYDDSVRWVSWVSKKDDFLFSLWHGADQDDWSNVVLGKTKKERSLEGDMRFWDKIPILKDKSWPEVYVKGTAFAYSLKYIPYPGLYLGSCQFKEIELKEEKKSTKKKVKKKETKKEEKKLIDETTIDYFIQKKLVYKNNDGETCSLIFYKSGYLEFSPNCSPLTKEYNYFNNYLFYTKEKIKLPEEYDNAELMLFTWFTLKDNEFLKNHFMGSPANSGSPKPFFSMNQWEDKNYTITSSDTEMQVHEIADVSCDASTYAELSKCSLPQILEFCEVEKFNPFKSYFSGGIYNRGSRDSLFTYNFEYEVPGMHSFASIELEKCINKINPIFSEIPKYLYFKFYFPGSTPISGTNRPHSGDVGKDWAIDEKLIGAEFIEVDFGSLGFEGADVKDPRFPESILRELNRKYDISYGELSLINTFMTKEQLKQCNVYLFSEKTVPCPKNTPSGFIYYYNNYNIILEIYYGLDSDLRVSSRIKMLFTDSGDVVRKISQRRIKVLESLGGL